MTVRSWLNSTKREYAAGLELYRLEKGDKDVWYGILSKGENPFTKSKLFELLKAIDKAKPSKSVESKPDKNDDGHARKYERSELPPRLQKVHDLKLRYFIQASHLNAEKNRLPLAYEYNNQRKEQMREIERLLDLNAKCWEDIDHYLKTGDELPEYKQFREPDPTVKTKIKDEFELLDEAGLIRKERSLNSARARYKREGKLELMEEKDRQIERVREKLKALKNKAD